MEESGIADIQVKGGQVNLKVEKLLAQLAKEDKAYLNDIKYKQKMKAVNIKRLLREKEGRNRFFRHRILSAGYEDGFYFGEGL